MSDFQFDPKDSSSCCEICGISSFSHRHEEGSLPKDFIMTEGEVESYAVENLEAERSRIYLILSRIVKSGEPLTDEVLYKVILGNKK